MKYFVSISSKITFYSLNVVNFTKVVKIIHNNLSVIVSNDTLLSLILHEMDQTIFLLDSLEEHLREE